MVYLSAHKDLTIYSHSCPLCRSVSYLLKGNKHKRYFCRECCVEFVTNDKRQVTKVYFVENSGDIKEIPEWKNIRG